MTQNIGRETESSKWFCGYCGKTNTEDSQFCNYCGKPRLVEEAAAEIVQDNSSEHAPADNEAKQSSSGVKVLAIVAIIVVLLAGATVVLIKTGLLFNNNKTNTASVEEEQTEINEATEANASEYPDNANDSYYVIGNSYQIMSNLRVREGPGKQYRILDREELSNEDYAISVDSRSTNDALLEKGKIIKCLGMEGDWMRIESGWVCVYDEGEYLVR